MLFLSASYVLNRPCVYCSLLIIILVFSIFDFQRPWFETPADNAAGPAPDPNATSSLAAGTLSETWAMAAATATSTARALSKAAVDCVKDKTASAPQHSGSWSEWAKGLAKKEWRIECLDVVVRF